MRFFANTAVGIFASTHPTQLMIFTQAGSLRSSLHELEDLLKEYSPLMGESTEWFMEKGIKYGAVFAEVSSPILWRPARG